MKSNYSQRIIELIPFFLFILLLEVFVGVLYLSITTIDIDISFFTRGLMIGRMLLSSFIYGGLLTMFLALFSKGVLRKSLIILFSLISVVLFLVESYLLNVYGIGIREETLTLLFSSNLQESAEFFETILLSWKTFILPLIFLALFIYLSIYTPKNQTLLWSIDYCICSAWLNVSGDEVKKSLYRIILLSDRTSLVAWCKIL